jgi:hypothetical protein
MKIVEHQPLLIAPPDREAEAGRTTRFLHAKLWVVAELEAWGERREGHLHVVSEIDSDRWSTVDLSDHPLRAAARYDDMPSFRQLELELRRWLDEWRLRFYASPALALVSEIGEDRDDFRRRVAGLIRPELQRRLDGLSHGARPRLPWRRRKAGQRRAELRAEMVEELARLLAGIEELELSGGAGAVRRAEAGVLVVAEGVTLHPPGLRDPLAVPSV